jgi:hypothetical protein
MTATAAPSPAAYLTAADRLLREVVPGVRGTWPRACAWLTRLALETALDDYWAAVNPAVSACRARRAQLLLLREHASPDVARRADYAWTALSRAGHHHSYELALTAHELRALGQEVAEVVAALHVACSPDPVTDREPG